MINNRALSRRCPAVRPATRILTRHCWPFFIHFLLGVSDPRRLRTHPCKRFTYPHACPATHNVPAIEIALPPFSKLGMVQPSGWGRYVWFLETHILQPIVFINWKSIFLCNQSMPALQKMHAYLIGKTVDVPDDRVWKWPRNLAEGFMGCRSKIHCCLSWVTGATLSACLAQFLSTAE